MTFYFYDLETSGMDPRSQRIMQFAGQRTDENFKRIGEPLTEYIYLTEEVLPDPFAILVTGITPQKTHELGYTEAEFLKLFEKHAVQPGTVFMGYNNIRFDDEFMRYVLYRNFYDPYEWQWQNNRSRWDLIDLVRMTRALRPEGIEWPFTEDGKPTNRLERLTASNKLGHDGAHNALSDVGATIELAKLLKNRQPGLFSFLLNNRGKAAITKLLSLDRPTPIVHSSGRIPGEFYSTSVFIPIAPHPSNNNAVLTYDLRFNPDEYISLSVEDLAKRAFTPAAELADVNLTRLPVKAIHINKSPAIAPLGVLNNAAQERIKLSMKTVKKHLANLVKTKGFANNVYVAWRQGAEFESYDDVDGQLYGGFSDEGDKKLMKEIRSKSANELSDYHPLFHDERFGALLLRYKARNYAQSLSDKELRLWDAYKRERIIIGVPGAPGLQSFMRRLGMLAQKKDLSSRSKFILEELRLYAQSIAPMDG